MEARAAKACTLSRSGKGLIIGLGFATAVLFGDDVPS
jgi:hypothetical protein